MTNKKQEVPEGFVEIQNLLNELEETTEKVKRAKGYKDPTQDKYSRVPCTETGGKFSPFQHDANTNDYVSVASGMPFCASWLKETTRLRELPGIVEYTYSAQHYSTPGNFMNEYNDHAALVIQETNLILQVNDIDLYKEKLKKEIAILKADPELNAQINEGIKQEFLKAVTPEKLINALLLRSDLSERTPGDLKREIYIATFLARSDEEGLAKYSPTSTEVSTSLQESFSAISATFRDVDPENIIPTSERQSWYREAAIAFVQARKLGPTLAEMNITLE